MNFGWSQVVTRDGKQLTNVGSHWPASRPLDQDMRVKMERTGVCMGCHQNMTNKQLWDKVNTTPGILTDKDHINKVNSILHKSVK